MSRSLTPAEAEQLSYENSRRLQLAAQARMLRGESGPLPPPAVREVVQKPEPPTLETIKAQNEEKIEALKKLGLYRKTPRMRPVISGYKPRKTWRPTVFPHQPGQYLTKLSRSVSREWRQILLGVSTTSLAGGKLTGAQGRNLIRIVEELRKHCFLRMDAEGNPVEVREQVVQVVDGEDFCFARECGLSPRSFYRALNHPLAHLFIRTQKVQYVEAETRARRNCATLFSVALYEPLMPEVLEDAYWEEPVELEENFVVPDFNCQDGGTKRRPLQNQKQKANCGKLTALLGGSSANALSGEARRDFLGWIDSARLVTKAADAPYHDAYDADLGGCLDRLRDTNPGLFEFAVQIAIHHDDPKVHEIAVVGYYKALIHLGVKRVRYWVQKVEKYRLQKQHIDNPGKLLTSHLSKEARKRTGFGLSDLGTEPGHYIS